MSALVNILGIIPAREGSKRVPQKNFRAFAGTTLTELAIHELATNAIRHGKASRLRVDFEGKDGSWKLVLSDDGECFDPMARVPRAFRGLREHGYGIGILHRVLERDLDLQFVYRRLGAWNYLEFHFRQQPMMPRLAPQASVDVFGWL